MLYGTSLLPEMISVGNQQVQLGDIVRRSQHDSGLSVDEWNAQEPLKREAYLAETIYKMRKESEKKT